METSSYENRHTSQQQLKIQNLFVIFAILGTDKIDLFLTPIF